VARGDGDRHRALSATRIYPHAARHAGKLDYDGLARVLGLGAWCAICDRVRPELAAGARGSAEQGPPAGMLTRSAFFARVSMSAAHLRPAVLRDSLARAHGPAYGGVVERLPARARAHRKRHQRDSTGAKPGSSRHVTQRQESTASSCFSVFSMAAPPGTAIGFLIRNVDQQSEGLLRPSQTPFRPGHADYTYWQKSGCATTAAAARVGAREPRYASPAGRSRRWPAPTL